MSCIKTGQIRQRVTNLITIKRQNSHATSYYFFQQSVYSEAGSFDKIWGKKMPLCFFRQTVPLGALLRGLKQF
jgi:hypothetical protein